MSAIKGGRAATTAAVLALLTASTTAHAQQEVLSATIDESLACASVVLVLGNGTALTQSIAAAFVRRAAELAVALRGSNEHPEEWTEFYTLAAYGRAEVHRQSLAKGGDTLRYMYEGMQEVCVSQVLESHS